MSQPVITISLTEDELCKIIQTLIIARLIAPVGEEIEDKIKAQMLAQMPKPPKTELTAHQLACGCKHGPNETCHKCF